MAASFELEKYAAHIAASRAAQQRLSDMELGYVKRYDQLMSTHLEHAVLQYLPEPMRGLDDLAPGGTASTPGGMGT